MPSDFSQLLSRVRCGDNEAAQQLIRRFESAVRVAVRTRLSDPRLRRQFDSLDVCQSVLASFFLHATHGAYNLDVPAQLLALLTRMAQNKVGTRARDQFRQRRDIRRLSDVPVEGTQVASRDPDPARQVEGRDLLERALEMMTPEIRAIAARRMDGETWPMIARALGGTPDARRKQFEHAVVTIASSLDIRTLRD